MLGVTALGATLEEALDKAYAAVGTISFEGAMYRKDIGRTHPKGEKAIVSLSQNIARF